MKDALNLNTCYENLAFAIIVRACDDYRKALKMLIQNYALGHKANNKELRWGNKTKGACEEFFTSDRFKKLTKLPGNELIRRLKEEVNYYEL